MLTQGQIDELNKRVSQYEETRYPFYFISLDDLIEVLGLTGHQDKFGATDSLSLLSEENPKKNLTPAESGV